MLEQGNGDLRDGGRVVDCVRSVVRVDFVVIFDTHRDFTEVKVTGCTGEPPSVPRGARPEWHMPCDPEFDFAVVSAYLLRVLQEYSEPF
jgi:hypothetical protein